MKFYSIKLEDKAAVLNRLKAAKVKLPSFKVHDNKMKGVFNIFIDNSEVQSIFEKILNSSPRIDIINKKDIKEILHKMVRHQLQEWAIKAPEMRTNKQLAIYLNKHPEKKAEMLSDYNGGYYALPPDLFLKDVEVCNECVNADNMGFDGKGYVGYKDEEDACIIKGATKTLVFSLKPFRFPYFSGYIDSPDELWWVERNGEPEDFRVEELSYDFGNIYIALWDSKHDYT